MRIRKLLSIVVPTKDRYKYLKYLIELVAGFHSDEVELVIQDNSENNSEFLTYLNNLGYDFIRYNHIRGQIPMSDNSDKAILNSTGEYVCFLGDDDGLTRYTIDCARWMKRNKVDAVKPALIYYYWPDSIKENKNSRSAALKFKSFSGEICYKDPFKELIKVLKKGITDRGEMPLVYHSIVSREALDRVYNKCNTFFPGNSPDISNAVALSLTVKKYATINLPRSFSGNSVYHGGGVYASGRKGQPDITEVPWFRPNVVDSWNKKLPRIAAPSLIWADSAMHALNEMGREDLQKNVSFNKLYFYFGIKNHEYRKMLLDFYPNKRSFYFFSTVTFVKKSLFSILKRFELLIGNKNKTQVLTGIENIIEAAKCLESKATFDSIICN